MFVRWKRRQSGGTALMCAYLVESFRHKGKTKHRILKYLAGIAERTIEEYDSSVGEQRLAHARRIGAFWSKVRNNLRSRLFASHQDEVCRLIQRRVPFASEGHATRMPMSGNLRIVVYRPGTRVMKGTVEFNTLGPEDTGVLLPVDLLTTQQIHNLKEKLLDMPLAFCGMIGGYVWEDQTPRH